MSDGFFSLIDVIGWKGIGALFLLLSVLGTFLRTYLYSRRWPNGKLVIGLILFPMIGVLILWFMIAGGWYVMSATTGRPEILPTAANIAFLMAAVLMVVGGSLGAWLGERHAKSRS